MSSGRSEVIANGPQKPSSLDRIYHPTKLAAIVDLLIAEGAAPDEALRDVGVSSDELHKPETLVSIQQVLTACRNAIRLTSDPAIAFRIGQSMHVSTFGMYGYAILCGPDFRRTMAFCEKYHVLATPLVDMAFAEGSGAAVWTIDPVVAAHPDDPIYRFLVEMQIGATLGLSRDVMGAEFSPRSVELVYSRDANSERFEALAGCAARFAQPANRFIFDGEWLDRNATFGNTTTYALVVSLCDDLVSELSARSGFAGRIRESLLPDIARRPTLAATAKRLGASERTLRRQLSLEGTSYRELVDELRAQVAIRYLRETAMTNDDIALSLGFSDAANFRHAFRRWTGRSPSVFRPSSRKMRRPIPHG